jgi:hypothetical protein
MNFNFVPYPRIYFETPQGLRHDFNIYLFFPPTKALNITFLETHNFYAFFGIMRNKSAFPAKKSNDGCDFNISLINGKGKNFRQ